MNATSKQGMIARLAEIDAEQRAMDGMPHDDACELKSQALIAERCAIRTALATTYRPDLGRRCHYCDRRTHYGAFSDFTDGKRYWVCSSCEEQMDIDLAQEQDQD